MTNSLPIHIINPFWDACGGSEQRALTLRALLWPHAKTHLWSSSKSDPRLAERGTFNVIEPELGRFPLRGTFVFVGVYGGTKLRHWIARTQPSRTIMVINTAQPEQAQAMMDLLAKAGPVPEIVYASQALKTVLKFPGIVEPSPIDIGAFRAIPRARNARFTVGRLSRDDALKHHPGDPAFYQRLAEAGCAVRIMGGRLLAEALAAGEGPHLTLLAAGAEPAVEFLRSLDCFFYRTSDAWFETYGRVVFEAMACGLPVVAERNGGYAEHIVHGRNGFLFRSEEEAFGIILRLKSDSALRARIGRAARAAVEVLYGPEGMDAIRAFYLRPPV